MNNRRQPSSDFLFYRHSLQMCESLEQVPCSGSGSAVWTSAYARVESAFHVYTRIVGDSHL